MFDTEINKAKYFIGRIYSGLKWLWLMILATFTAGDLQYEGTAVPGFSWKKITSLVLLKGTIDLVSKHVTEPTYLLTLYCFSICLFIYQGFITVPDTMKWLAQLKNGSNTPPTA